MVVAPALHRAVRQQGTRVRVSQSDACRCRDARDLNRATSRNLNTLRRGIVVDRRFVRLFDLENLAEPELSQRRYVVLEGDKSWCCVQHYHQL